MEKLRDKNGLTEEEFLKNYRPGKYPQPSLTADIVIFGEDGDGGDAKPLPDAMSSPKVLLIRRGAHPFLGQLALPGGFAKENEPVEQTASRELAEETGCTDLSLKLTGIYSEPGRDPRGWVVSAAYATVVRMSGLSAEAGDDAASVCWEPVYDILDGTLSLAFDHNRIVRDAYRIIYGVTA